MKLVIRTAQKYHDPAISKHRKIISLQYHIQMVQSFCEPCAWQAGLPRWGLAPVKPQRYGALGMKRTVVPMRMTWGQHRRGSAPMFIANATQEVNAQVVAQQVGAQPTPSKKSKEPHFSPRPPRFPRTELSKENADYAHDRKWFHMSLGEGSSDSDDSTEKHHHEKFFSAPVPKKRSATGKALP